MDTNEVERRVRAVIARTFRCPDEDGRELRMGDPPEWDSLGHMNLVVELEAEFGVRLPSYSISDVSSTSGAVRVIAELLAHP